MDDILLITVDSLRADHVSAYGYSRETTPFIDEFATDGRTFTNAFSHAGATRFSFPSILTSSTAKMFGGVERLSGDRTLISEVLHDGGYRTAGFHSNAFLSGQLGYGRGFEKYCDAQSETSTTARLRQYIKNSWNQDGIPFRTLKWLFDRTEQHAGVEVGSAYEVAEGMTDRALEWLSGIEDGPIFLWVHYMDVHHPYLPPDDYQTRFRNDPISDRRAVKLRRRMLEDPWQLTASDKQDLIDLYDAEIRYVDSQISRLLEGVRDELGEDPITILTSDHGEEFGEHGQYSHNTLHDEGIHVPLVIHDGTAANHDEIVGLMDVPPTIANYANCEIPNNYFGFPLQQLYDGKWDREFVIGEGGGQGNYFYRDHQWKYIVTDGEQLYNIVTDPQETNNIIDDNPENIEYIRGRIAEHEQRIEATKQDLGTVELDDETIDRLEKLGYLTQ